MIVQLYGGQLEWRQTGTVFVWGMMNWVGQQTANYGLVQLECVLWYFSVFVWGFYKPALPMCTATL